MKLTLIKTYSNNIESHINNVFLFYFDQLNALKHNVTNSVISLVFIM